MTFFFSLFQFKITAELSKYWSNKELWSDVAFKKVTLDVTLYDVNITHNFSLKEWFEKLTFGLYLTQKKKKIGLYYFFLSILSKKKKKLSFYPPYLLNIKMIKKNQ